MQLTNFSFLNARNEFLSSIAKRKVAADRIETGKRLEQTTKDLGAISQASKQNLQLINDRSSINNLKNLRNFLYAQEVSLNRVYEMYDKIEELAIKAANPITTEEERKDYQLEFEDYQKQLENIMVSRYQGKLLFSNTEMCGGIKDVPLGELDLASGKPSGVSHAVRAQTIPVGSPSGTISFRVNSGGASDIYRVWMGDIPVFSMGPAFKGDDHTKQYDDPTDFSFPNGGWATSGSANEGDDDLVEVTFGPGMETTYKIYPGYSNTRPSDGTLHQNRDVSDIDADGNTNESIYDLRTGWKSTDNTSFTVDTDNDGILDSPPLEITRDQYNALPSGGSNAVKNTRTGQEDYQNWANDSTNAVVVGDLNIKKPDPNAGYYSLVPNEITTQDLPENFDRTELTLQIETSTIGIIYAEGSSGNDNDSDGTGTPGIEFKPLEFIREIPIDSPENLIFLDAKGFETLDGRSIALPSLAQELVDVMRGKKVNGVTEHFGEMKCLLENRLGILGSEYKRVDYEIAELEDQLIANEAAYGRITGADMAAEATQFAKQSIKTNMAVEVMSNSTRLKDVLIPLTTEHFRSSVLSAGI